MALKWYKGAIDPNFPIQLYEALTASWKDIGGRVWHDVALQFQENYHITQVRRKPNKPRVVWEFLMEHLTQHSGTKKVETRNGTKMETDKGTKIETQCSQNRSAPCTQNVVSKYVVSKYWQPCQKEKKYTYKNNIWMNHKQFETLIFFENSIGTHRKVRRILGAGPDIILPLNFWTVATPRP